MKGTNKITLCPAEMCRALETFLNEHTLRDPVHVTDIKKLSDGYGDDGYVVTIEDPDAPE